MTAHQCDDTNLACRNLAVILTAREEGDAAVAAARAELRARSNLWVEALVHGTDVDVVLAEWQETSEQWGTDESVWDPTDWDDLSEEMVQEARDAFAAVSTEYVERTVEEALAHLQEQLLAIVDAIPGIVAPNAQDGLPMVIDEQYAFDWDQLLKSGTGVAKDILKRGIFGGGRVAEVGGGVAAAGAAAGAGAARIALGGAAAALTSAGPFNEWARLRTRLRGEIIAEVTDGADRVGMHIRGAVSEAARAAARAFSTPLELQLRTRQQHLEEALAIAEGSHVPA